MCARHFPDNCLRVESFKLPKVCKRVGKLVWTIDNTHFKAFRQLLMDHFSIVSSNTDLRMSRVRECASDHHSYIIKRVSCGTCRIAMSCLREFDMQEKVWKSSFGKFKGCDVCPEPVVCGLVWEKKKWWFIVVSERVDGYPINHLRSFRPPCCFSIEIDRDDVVSATGVALRTLWNLGFAHNDAHDGNVVYDPGTKTAKIVDYETCVDLPVDAVQALRKETSCVVSHADWVISFDKHYSRKAVRALKELEQWCLGYLRSDDTVSNSDADCIEIMLAVLPKKMRV